jgi:putative ABC transport system ATP-binding protein
MGAAAGLEFELRCTRGDGRDSFRIATPRVELGAGEILALTGPSGSGKSTVLELLGLVLEPEAGSHFLWRLDARHTIDIAALWRFRTERLLCGLRAQHLGFVLQSGGLVPFLTVRENIALPRTLAGMRAWHGELDELIERLGIGHQLDKKPHQLSLGERQRTAIARALAHDPPLLLADEPTAALDPARAEIVMDLLVNLVRGRERMAVVVTHDRDLIRKLELRELRAHPREDGKAAEFAHAS